MLIIEINDPAKLEHFLESVPNLGGWRFATANAICLDVPSPIIAAHIAPAGVNVLRDVDLVPVPILQAPERAAHPGDPSHFAAALASIGVAIIDAGIDSRPDLGISLPAERRLDFRSGEPELDAKPASGDHGIAMAFVATRSGNVKLWSLRATKAHAMAVAIDWVVKHNQSAAAGDRIRVICTAMQFKNNDPATRDFLEQRIAAAVASGVTVCVALGNAPPLRVPATAGAAITVGAYDEKDSGRLDDDEVHGFDDTPTAFRKPEVLCRFQPYPLDDRSLGAGTSLGTAYLTKVIAVWLGTRPDLSPAEILANIRASEQRLNDGVMRSTESGGFPVVRGPDFPPAPKGHASVNP